MTVARGRPLLAEAAPIGAGLLLFAVAAAAERLVSASPLAAALIEEALKTLTILGFGLAGFAGAGPGRHGALRAIDPSAPPLPARLALGAAARGLSRGLVACAAFAGAENIAYFLAYPEAGILARFLWSAPVHLDAALLAALAAAPLFPALRGGPRRIVPAAALLALGAAAASGLHGGANLAVARGLPDSLYLGGSALCLAAFPALATAFARRAYIGGFLHGAD